MSTLPPLFGVAQALFYYGYVGFYFSNSPWFPIVVALVLVSREAATDSFDSLFLLPFAVGIGSWVASLLISATLLPTLVPHLAYIMRFEVTSKDKAESTDNDGEILVETDARPYRFAGGLLLALAGILLLLLDTSGSNIGHTGIVIFGFGLILFGITLFVWSIAQYCLSGVRADAADARYLIYMLLYFTLPTLYVLAARIARPFEGVVFLFALGLLSALVGLIEAQMIGVGSLGTSIMLEHDPRFVRAGRYPIGIARRWILLLATPLALVYIVGWILDELSNGDIRITTIGVIIMALILGASAFCCCGRRPQIFMSSAAIEEQEEQQRSDDTALSRGNGNTVPTKRRIGVVLPKEKQ